MEIKSIKINDEMIHIFDYALFIFDGNENDYSLSLDIMVSEVVALKFYNEDKVKVCWQYNNGEEQTFMMNLDHVTEVGNTEIPELNLTVDIDNPKDFWWLKTVNFDTKEEYPSLRKDITIDEIRKVEMPDRELDLTVMIPIDLEEWLYRSDNQSEILKEALYDYRKKKASE
ncbi:hypothetical protein [Neobacillus drentensis]|uniref:hypothetical protein n=1 Tax=Neobacillus drentensis TaxID=220684 RepID=UPI002FFDB8C5